MIEAIAIRREDNEWETQCMNQNKESSESKTVADEDNLAYSVVTSD